MVDSFLLNRVRIRLCKGWRVLIALVSPLFWSGHYRGRIFVCQKKLYSLRYSFCPVYTSRMKVIGTTEAAKRLGVNPSRVRALIDAGRLKAQKIGREYAINPSDLKAVRKRKPGRPRKSRKTTKR